MYSFLISHLFSPSTKYLGGSWGLAHVCFLSLSCPLSSAVWNWILLSQQWLFPPQEYCYSGANSLLAGTSYVSIKTYCHAFDNFWALSLHISSFSVISCLQCTLDPSWMPVLSSQLGWSGFHFAWVPLSCSGPQTTLQQKAEMIWELASFDFLSLRLCGPTLTSNWPILEKYTFGYRTFSTAKWCLYSLLI